MSIPRLYVIVDAETLIQKGVRMRDLLRELRDAGVRLVQYRDKVSAPHEVVRAAGEISEVFAGTGAMLVMNDSVKLALAAGWSAVHVGQGDLPVGAAKKALTQSAQSLTPSLATAFVGVSTHNGTQVLEADTTAADYVAIGPVFATASKKNAEPVVGLEGVRRARACTTKPLVAIGGITLENCASVIEAGADCVAVIGGMFVAGRSVGDVARDFLDRLR